MDAKYTNKDNFKGNAYEHIKFLSRSYDRFGSGESPDSGDLIRQN